MTDPKKHLMLYALILVIVLAAASLSAYVSRDIPVPVVPSLGRAGTFAVLGGSTVTSTGATRIAGDVGVSSPGVSITGFPPATIVGGAQHVGDSSANQAQRDAGKAYAALAALACGTPLTGQNLGGKHLVPGVYCFTSSARVAGQLVLNGRENANAVWVFQIGSTLTTAPSSSVVMGNSGRAGHVYWQVGSSATLDTATAFAGNILAAASITMNADASLAGRALARAAVTLIKNNIKAVPYETKDAPGAAAPAAHPKS